MALKETTVILVLIFLISILALIPYTTNQLNVTPPETTYTLTHNYVPDFYQYLSWMKDGSDGKVMITSRMTPDAFARKPVYIFYSISGLIFSKLGVNLFLSYTIMRIVLGISLLFVIYLLINRIISNPMQRTIAFAFALFLPPFFSIKPLSLLWPNLTSIDPLQRVFFLSHDLATVGLFVLGLLFLEQSPVITAILFALASIANPAMLAFFYLFLMTGLGLQLIVRKTSKISLIKKAIVACAPGGFLIIYYQRLFATTLPFSWLFAQQKLTDLHISYFQFLLTAGPALLLALPSITKYIKSEKLINKVIASWALWPLAIYPLMRRFLPISPERVFELSWFIPLAILASETIKKLPKYIVTVTLVILAVFSGLYGYVSLKQQTKLFAFPYYNIYVPNLTIEAMRWLDKNTPDESIVAASFYTSNMIPAFSHNKVLFGHSFVTYNAPERERLNNAIFDKTIDPEVLKNILRSNNISYILFSPDSPKYDQTNLVKTGLATLVFQNPTNQIFKISY